MTWSDEAWDSLKKAFPNETSISKLFLTSRNLHVADYVNPKCFIYKPQVLNAKQSWELLRLKAVPKGDYLDTRDREKMEELGREMVVNCAGLPLAIVVLGGILVTKPTFIEWEKVYNDSMFSLKRGKGLGEVHQREVFDILVWSYNVLPPQLKSCFLYMGKFGEDEEIEADNLYQLWIAEGIVLSSDKRGEETMMEVAESYMGELVHKSMVQVEFEDNLCSQRKFKSFMLHDLMRDLSLFIAKREDYSKVVDLREVNDFHTDSSMELLTSSSTRQLVLQFELDEYDSIKNIPLLVNKANQRRLRSFLLFDHVVFDNRTLPRLLESQVANFRFLRVFALEGIYLGNIRVSRYPLVNNLEKVLGSLVYLRYLSLRHTGLLMFPSIQKLELLKTLKLDTGYTIMSLPPWMSGNSLSKLMRLQHLYLPLSWEVHMSRKNFKLRFNGLSKLETLENFKTNWCEVKDLPGLISLQKLRIRVEGSYYEVEEVIKCLSSLSCLRCLSIHIDMFSSGFETSADMLRQLLWNHKLNLQELGLRGKLPDLGQIFGQQLDTTHISLLRITILELSFSNLEEDPMPVLEKIPTLRVLSCLSVFVGREMVFSAMGFQKLILLQLYNLPALEKWRVEEGSMPILSKLFISECPKLEELPQGLSFLSSLGTLELSKMPLHFCDRVRGVNGEQGPDFYKVAHVSDLFIYEIN